MGTTAKGYPYPDGTDAVVDGDDAIRALAEAIDAKLPYATASGIATVTNVAAGATKSATITLPSGRFTRSPTMIAMAPTTSPPQRLASILTGGSTSSFTLYAYNGTNAARDIQANWVGVQDGAASLLTDPGPGAAPDVTVACPTIGCANRGIAVPISSTWVDEDGESHTVDEVECGVCGTDITDTMQPIEG